MDDLHLANASELASIPRVGRKSLTILYGFMGTSAGALLNGATLRYRFLRFDKLRRRSDRASSGEAKVAQSCGIHCMSNNLYSCRSAIPAQKAVADGTG